VDETGPPAVVEGFEDEAVLAVVESGDTEAAEPPELSSLVDDRDSRTEPRRAPPRRPEFDDETRAGGVGRRRS
jgi:hypothetical protein